jgi:hypothetical protein
VAEVSHHVVKKVDLDYFEEERCVAALCEGEGELRGSHRRRWSCCDF